MARTQRPTVYAIANLLMVAGIPVLRVTPCTEDEDATVHVTENVNVQVPSYAAPVVNTHWGEEEEWTMWTSGGLSESSLILMVEDVLLAWKAHATFCEFAAIDSFTPTDAVRSLKEYSMLPSERRMNIDRILRYIVGME